MLQVIAGMKMQGRGYYDVILVIVKSNGGLTEIKLKMMFWLLS